MPRNELRVDLILPTDEAAEFFRVSRDCLLRLWAAGAPRIRPVNPKAKTLRWNVNQILKTFAEHRDLLPPDEAA